MAFQGIDIRQTGDRIVFRASLKDDTGAILASGTTNLRLYEVQSDGSLKSYDWNDNTFKTTALTTENQAMTHRTGNNSTTNTGIWTHALTTLSGFTAGNLYVAQIANSGATPTEQEREFQFGVASAFDPFDAVRGGLTALPNANADAAGGLPISDSGGLDMDGLATAAALATVDGVADSILVRVNHQPTCWYIDADASGNNDGTSPTDAWETLTDFGSASAAGMKPGDWLFINGTFTGESLFLDVDGITVRMKAYIDGTGDTTSTAGVRLEANFIDIEGGEIANFDGPSNDGYGVRLSDKRFCKIRKMRVHDNYFGGILVRSARGTLVEDNFAYDNGVKGIVVSNNQAADPDPNNADVIVSRNWITGNGRIGLQLGGTNGLENARGIEAFENYISGNGIGCRLESAFYVKLHHNVFENNDLTGVDPSALDTQTELEIQDGDGSWVYDNVFLGKTTDANFIDFTFSDAKAQNHKIFRNKIYNNSSGCNSLRIAINETDGIEITDNWFICPNTAQSDRGLVLAAALNGLVAGNVFVGFGEAVKLNSISAVAIEATDWTFTENTFDGQAVQAIETGGTADATLIGNRFVNQTTTYVTLGGSDYTDANIATKDTTVRFDAPNYKGPTTGSFIARDYSIRQVSTDQVTQQANVTAVLADTADMQPKIGATNDLGNGATLFDNLQDIAGATFDDTTDSLEAIRNRGDAAWTTGSGGGSGSGAYTVTITVDDGSDPLEGAVVRMYRNVANDYRSTTGADGVTDPAFSLDAATYTVSITLAGYTFAPVTLAVSADASKTYSMSSLSITPSEVGQTTGYFTCYDEDGVSESGVEIECELKTPSSSAGLAYDTKIRRETSDANGLVQFTNLFKGATYRFRRGSRDVEWWDVVVPSDASTTVALDSIAGED